MIGRTNAGGVGKLFSVIAVSYPAGSVCTCTDGTKTLKAKDTSGKALFNVPSAGTWTVICTDGTDTASQPVTITTAGQAESIGLFYIPYLYKDGDERTSLTGGWDTSGYTWGTTPFQGVTKKSDSMVIQGIYNAYRGGVGTVNKVSLKGYSTLKALGRADSGALTRVYILTKKDAENGQAAYANFSTAETEISIDLKSIQGDYYIAIVCDSSSGTKTATVKKIWLE